VIISVFVVTLLMCSDLKDAPQELIEEMKAVVHTVHRVHTVICVIFRSQHMPLILINNQYFAVLLL